jgi:hypothetical protein
MAKFTPFEAGRDMRLRMGSRNAFITPTAETVNALESYIRWCEAEVPSQLPHGISNLVKIMALTNQGVAREMSFGRDDPQQQHPEWAWRLPVRRISGTYYSSWQVRMVNAHTAELYNDSREAYYIEFGINPRGNGRRVRRPVRKLSLNKTMKLMMTTQAYHRIWVGIFADPKHRFSRGVGFTQIVQSPAGGHSRWEEISLHEARSMINRARYYGGSTMNKVAIRHNPRGGHSIVTQRLNAGGGRFTGRLRGRRLP